jgi:AcrR family transcriptional regulator
MIRPFITQYVLAMKRPKRPALSSRKKPQQSRSNELVTAILQAAAQVLAKEGMQRFTTARVAEKAGVCVGSLYQYFPNKASILFRLQSDEWQQTGELLSNILRDSTRQTLERLRLLVHSFIKSECEEADVRVALNDAAPLYRDAPESKTAKAFADLAMRSFMQEVLPRASRATRASASELIVSVLTATGKQFSETPRTAVEIEAYSTSMSDMFCAYLQRLRRA